MSIDLKPSIKTHIAFHILGWIINGVNLLLPIFFAPKILGLNLPDHHTTEVLSIGAIHITMQMAVFYSNFFFIFDIFFKQKSKSYYFILSALIILTAWLFETTLLTQDWLGLRPPMPEFNAPPQNPFPDFLLPLFTAYFASFLVKLYPLYLAQQLEQANLYNQKQTSQLNLLKGQIQPHFLFNTLNNFRYLLRNAPEKAEHAILQLSDLLRYTVSSSEKETVNISEEIAYINNYIALQKIRLPKEVEVEVIYKLENLSFQISPLLLIPFIENAFKYGVSAQYPGYILIDIHTSKTHFNFTVNNRNYPHKSKSGTGIGISNVKERLSYLYPDKHKLQIINHDNDFTVNLLINLE